MLDAGAPKQGDHKGRPYGDRHDVGAPLVGALVPHRANGVCRGRAATRAAPTDRHAVGAPLVGALVPHRANGVCRGRAATRVAPTAIDMT
jgi:hypothetical protein